MWEEGWDLGVWKGGPTKGMGESGAAPSLTPPGVPRNPFNTPIHFHNYSILKSSIHTSMLCTNELLPRIKPHPIVILLYFVFVFTNSTQVICKYEGFYINYNNGFQFLSSPNAPNSTVDKP